MIIAFTAFTVLFIFIIDETHKDLFILEVHLKIALFSHASRPVVPSVSGVQQRKGAGKAHIVHRGRQIGSLYNTSIWSQSARKCTFLWNVCPMLPLCSIHRYNHSAFNAGLLTRTNMSFVLGTYVLLRISMYTRHSYVYMQTNTVLRMQWPFMKMTSIVCKQ